MQKPQRTIAIAVLIGLLTPGVVAAAPKEPERRFGIRTIIKKIIGAIVSDDEIITPIKP